MQVRLLTVHYKSVRAPDLVEELPVHGQLFQAAGGGVVPKAVVNPELSVSVVFLVYTLDMFVHSYSVYVFV